MFASVLAAISALQQIFGGENYIAFGRKIIIVFVQFAQRGNMGKVTTSRETGDGSEEKISMKKGTPIFIFSCLLRYKGCMGLTGEAGFLDFMRQAGVKHRSLANDDLRKSKCDLSQFERTCLA